MEFQGSPPSPNSILKGGSRSRPSLEHGGYSTETGRVRPPKVTLSKTGRPLTSFRSLLAKAKVATNGQPAQKETCPMLGLSWSQGSARMEAILVSGATFAWPAQMLPSDLRRPHLWSESGGLVLRHEDPRSPMDPQWIPMGSQRPRDFGILESLPKFLPSIPQVPNKQHYWRTL